LPSVHNHAAGRAFRIPASINPGTARKAAPEAKSVISNGFDEWIPAESPGELDPV